jgi:hypothetical protein
MRRRRLLLGAGLLAVLAFAGVLLAPRLLAPEPGVTAENFQRIRKGMTLEEVEAILGQPGSWGNQPPSRFGADDGPVRKVWSNRRDTVIILAVPIQVGDGRRRVWSGTLLNIHDHTSAELTDPDWFGRLRDWLGW